MTLSGAWEAAIDAFLADQQYNDIARSTLALRRWQLRHVGRVIGSVDPFTVSREQLAGWARERAKGWKADTRRSYRTTLRGFYGWALENRFVESSPAQALKRVKPAQPNPQAAPDRVYLPAIAAAGPRERLMMRLAAIQGLRCCEVAKVWPERDLVDVEDGWALLVHGKGDRERLIALEDGMARDLLSLPPGHAFPSQRAGHLTPSTVGRVCNPLLPGRWSMHKLRHRAGTRFYYACGMDMRLTAAFLGHADTKTTMIYVQPDLGRMRVAVNRAAA